MRRFVPLLATCLLTGSLLAAIGCQPGGAGGATVEPKTEEQKTFYAIGLWVANKLAPFTLTNDELSYVMQGLRDGVAGKKPLVEMSVYGPKMNELAKSRGAVKAEKDKAKAAKEAAEEKPLAEAYLAKAAAEPGAEKLPSGLIYKSMKEGTGESPKATDRVTVNYHGTLRDGKVFDSSRDRGKPASFGLNGVIPCWTEGVQKMKVGGMAKLTCPASIAYKETGHPPTIPGNATLTFEIELISIDAPPAPGMSPMPPGLHPGMNIGGPGIRPGAPMGQQPAAHPGMGPGANQQHAPITPPTAK